MDTKSVSFHGVTYKFPKEHITAATYRPENHLYVRLAPPHVNFHLVLDEWSDRPSPHGPEFPRISRLSDNRFKNLAIIPSAIGPVVCDQGPQPHFSCGIQIEDGPVKWSILFDRESLGQASEIRRKATSLIQSYRSGYAQSR